MWGRDPHRRPFIAFDPGAGRGLSRAESTPPSRERDRRPVLPSWDGMITSGDRQHRAGRALTINFAPDDPYFIAAKASIQETRPRTLKHGDTFVVLDRAGNMPPEGRRRGSTIAIRAICRCSSCWWPAAGRCCSARRCARTTPR